MKTPHLLFSLLAALFVSVSVSAGTLTSYVSMDNGYNLYLSTSDNTAGTLLGSGNLWTTTYVNTSFNLNAGTDYYLHVYGYDQGGIGGFLGRFELSGLTHHFANGAVSLLTNTTDWKGNAVAFNGSYSAVSYLGSNGAYPWGTRPQIPGSASWIWVGDGYSNDNSFFSTKISANAVPDAASTSALVLLSLTGLLYLRRKYSA